MRKHTMPRQSYRWRGIVCNPMERTGIEPVTPCLRA
jgi:hypothetical protein